MFSDLLSDLVAALSPFEPLDLLKAAAALQLVPENAERAQRLIALAHAAASLPAAPEKTLISAEELDRLCSSAPLGSGIIAEHEDPFENPFTESFAFYGDAFLVFPGNTEEDIFVLQQLVTALFLWHEPFPDPALVEEARHLLWAILLLSSELAQRIGIGRGVEPHSVADASVVIPPAEHLARLKQAVCFDTPTLTRLLDQYHLPLSVLDRFTVPSGQASLSEYQVNSGELLHHPLVKIEDQLIVALPGKLLVAARHALICLAIERGQLEALAQRYAASVWSSVFESLRLLPTAPAPIDLPDPPQLPCFYESWFHLDTDKLLYVALVTDPLTGYDPHEALSDWSTTTIAHDLADRLQVIEAFAHGLSHPPKNA